MSDRCGASDTILQITFYLSILTSPYRCPLPNRTSRVTMRVCKPCFRGQQLLLTCPPFHGCALALPLYTSLGFARGRRTYR
jgi:hypothetical protein